jgi:hypothetical protein
MKDGLFLTDESSTRYNLQGLYVHTHGVLLLYGNPNLYVSADDAHAHARTRTYISKVCVGRCVCVCVKVRLTHDARRDPALMDLEFVLPKNVSLENLIATFLASSAAAGVLICGSPLPTPFLLLLLVLLC